MTTIYLGRAGANVATLKAHLKNGRTCMKLSPVDTSLLLESTYGGNTQQSKCLQCTAAKKESKIPLLVNLNQEQPWQIELATDKLPALHTRLCKSSQRCHVPTQVNTRFKNFRWIKTNKHVLWQGWRPKYCPSGRRKVSEKHVRFTCCFLRDAHALQKLMLQQKQNLNYGPNQITMCGIDFKSGSRQRGLYVQCPDIKWNSIGYCPESVKKVVNWWFLWCLWRPLCLSFQN